MAVHHLIDDGQAGVAHVPDVLGMDTVPVGTGASIVVAVAAAIALVLTILVATLSSVVTASAGPVVHPTIRNAFTDVTDAGFTPSATSVAYKITDVLPARDGTFAVVSQAEKDASLAPIVVVSLLAMTLLAGTRTLRGLKAGLAGPVRTRREPRTAKPTSRGR